MRTNNTPNGTEGPPAARGHAAADAAAPSPTTVHAPSSTSTSNNTNSNYNNPPAAINAAPSPTVHHAPPPTGLNNLPAANETVAPRALSNNESIELRKLLKATLKIADTQDEEDAILLLDYAMDLVEDGESVGHIAGELLLLELPVFDASTVDDFEECLSSFLGSDTLPAAPLPSAVHGPYSTQANNSPTAIIAPPSPTNNPTSSTPNDADKGWDNQANGLELIDDHGPPVPIGTIEAQLDEAEWGGKPFAKPSGKLEQIKDDEGPHHASAMLSDSLEATNKSPARRHVEIINDNAVPINPFEPPRPFNIANYDEGEDAKLKSEAKQVGASKHEDSIIVPTEEDMADGITLDPAISRERRIRGNEGEAVDLELGGEVEPLQSEEEESEELLQGDLVPYNSELPAAYIVEEESEQDVVIATQLEPTLPWWKQRRTKLFLSALFVVFAVMAIALGVSMSSSSGGEPLVVEVLRTDTPSESLVPTSIPSVSLRPSVHPSLPPTTTPSQSPTFTPSQTPSLPPTTTPSQSPTFTPSQTPSQSPTTTPSPTITQIPSQPPTTTQSPSFTRLGSLKIVVDDGAADDDFGRSVAVFGDTVVVGARYDDDKGDSSGSAYIYNRDATTKEWIFQQKLVPDDGAADDEFGWSVAIHGDTVVVGASWDDDKGTNSGSAYIYHQDPETKEWIFQQKLVPDDGAADDEFGWSVAIHGDTVVVGASWDDDKGTNSGSAYIYHQDPETKEWIFQQKLVPDDGAADDNFGWSVAIYNGTVVVGAVYDDDKGTNSGSAYIYNRDPTTKEWIFQQKLVPDDGTAYDVFGGSVAVFGDTVVVGAVYDDDKGEDSGSAYIYNRDPTTKEWIFQQKLVPDDGAEYDYFGVSVAVFGDTVVVGAVYDDDKGEDSGSAYIYNRDPTTKQWTQQQKLVPDDGAADDQFGSIVAIYNGTVVVGAYRDDDKGTNSGSVYVYS